MKTKDIEISGVHYRIGQFTAQVGSWILMQVLQKVLPSFAGPVEEQLGNLPPNRATMSEEDFYRIQNHCLAICCRYEESPTGRVPMPLMASGVFAIKELEYDLPTVMALTIQALFFNLTPFFAEGGLSSLSSLQGLSQSPSPA